MKKKKEKAKKAAGCCTSPASYSPFQAPAGYITICNQLSADLVTSCIPWFSFLNYFLRKSVGWLHYVDFLAWYLVQNLVDCEFCLRPNLINRPRKNRVL